MGYGDVESISIRNNGFVEEYMPLSMYLYGFGLTSRYDNLMRVINDHSFYINSY